MNLESRWHLLCEIASLEKRDYWTELHRAYTASQLSYHNLDHIESCLELLQAHSDLAEDSIGVELAVWFHDIIYDPKKSDNEARSAQVAREVLEGSSYQQKVADLILATRHNLTVSDGDAQLLCDIDLSILGADDDRYHRYAIAIREEYAWVPERDYRKGRREVLQGFLQRKSIYQLDTFQKLFEKSARRNLEAEITSLSDSSKPA